MEQKSDDAQKIELIREKVKTFVKDNTLRIEESLKNYHFRADKMPIDELNTGHEIEDELSELMLKQAAEGGPLHDELMDLEAEFVAKSQDFLMIAASYNVLRLSFARIVNFLFEMSVKVHNPLPKRKKQRRSLEKLLRRTHTELADCEERIQRELQDIAQEFIFDVYKYADEHNDRDYYVQHEHYHTEELLTLDKTTQKMKSVDEPFTTLSLIALFDTDVCNTAVDGRFEEDGSFKTMDNEILNKCDSRMIRLSAVLEMIPQWRTILESKLEEIQKNSSCVLL